MEISDRNLGRFIDSADPWVMKVNDRGWRCYWCGKILTLRTLTKDHLQPICRGGADTMENSEPCCRNCNSRKGYKTEDEFIAYRGAIPALCVQKSNGTYLLKEDLSLTSSTTAHDLDVGTLQRPKAIARLRHEGEDTSWAWRNPS